MAKNVIQHHEWNTRNPKRLQTFYSNIFDWKFNDKVMPGYTLIDGIGGIFEITPEMGDMPTGVTNYVNVADVDATEKRIREAGGTIYKSKQEVPNMGWFTIFADPDNNGDAANGLIAPGSIRGISPLVAGPLEVAATAALPPDQPAPVPPAT